MSDEESTNEGTPSMNDWNAQVIEEFRANNGVLGGPFAGATVLLLHTNGAKSGLPRINPVDVYKRQLEVLVTPLTLRTYWRAAATTSSGVAAGSRPRSVVMFRHITRA